jgi:hypothetical protein
MTDYRQITIAGGLRHDPVNRAHDPRLRIDCRFPASNARLRLNEERIDHRFELSRREVTGRRSVILTEVVDDTPTTDSETVGEDLGAVSRFALAACKDAPPGPHPCAGGQRTHARSATLIERPLWNGNARIDHHIRVGNKENRGHLLS